MKRFFALILSAIIAIFLFMPALAAVSTIEIPDAQASQPPAESPAQPQTPANSIYAQELTDLTKIISPQALGLVVQLTDRNPATKVTASTEASITIICDQPVYQMYLIWETPPNPWDLVLPESEGSARIAYGEDGFVHEYISFDKPMTKYAMLFHGIGNLLCDVYTFGEGETPPWVEKWQPPCEDADILMFPAAAGDEFLFFGGAIPQYAVENDMQVQLAYMTNQWTDYSRVNELLNGLYSSGMRNYPVFSPYPALPCKTREDACLVYSESALVDYEIEQIRRFKPEVVVGLDLSGEGGDGLRRLSADTLLNYAVKDAGDASKSPQSAQKYGAFDVQKAYLHLYLQNEIRLNWDAALTKLNNRTALEVSQSAITNTARASEWANTAKDAAFDNRKFGLAHTMVGADVNKNDFFENITRKSTDPLPPKQPEPELSPIEIPAAEPEITVNDNSPTVLDSLFMQIIPDGIQKIFNKNTLYIIFLGLIAVLFFAAGLFIRKTED